MASSSLGKAFLSLKKASLLFCLCLCLMVVPAKGGNFRWWMVRLFDQKYYFIHENGYYVEMDPEDVASLQEAFTHHPEIAVYIHGHSQLRQDAGPYPPTWDHRSQQWLISRYEPDYNDHVASPIDLDDYISSWAPATGRDEWDDWQAWEDKAWEGYLKNEACEGSDPNAASSSPSPSRTHPRWSEERYAAKGWGSATRRFQRRQLQREGKPVPAHLKPVKVQYCKEVKREMKNMWMAMRQAAEAETEEEMPKYKPPKPAKAEKDDGQEEEEEDNHWTHWTKWEYYRSPSESSESSRSREKTTPGRGSASDTPP